MSTYVSNTSDKKKSKAMKYCAAGGWFGLHQYYVGKIGTGILYTFTFGLFFFGWFIDLFKIANGTFRDNVGAPLREK